MTTPRPRCALAGALLCAAVALPAFARELAAQDLPGEPVAFTSHGAKLQGRFFRAPGANAHPTVVLLHGYPGARGDVLGLGPALSAAGWNVLMFNYRGFHESEGRHTPLSSLEDVSTALLFLRDSARSRAVDTTRLVLAGYSYGGGIALLAGAREPAVRCVAAIAPANLGYQARLLATDTAFRKALRASIEQSGRNGVVRDMPWDSIAPLLSQHADELDATGHAAQLAGRPVLVVGGWRDQAADLEHYVLPLVRALRSAGNAGVTPVTLDDDHGFRATRGELHRLVISWLNASCAPTAAPRGD